jgi:hypothetical protein
LYGGNHLRNPCRGTFWRKGVGRALFTGLPYFIVYRAGEVFAGWGYAEGVVLIIAVVIRETVSLFFQKLVQLRTLALH